MPKHWYRCITEPKSEEDIFNNSICVDKKPYFMSYIYPDLRKKYNTFVKTQTQGLRRVSDPEYRETYYENKNPVNDNSCVMNRLCHMVENEFSEYKTSLTKKDFDPEILKSDYGYKKETFNKIHRALENLYASYGKSKRSNISNMKINENKINDMDCLNEIDIIKDSFKVKCLELCSNEDELCNILIDICYSSNNRKSFVWEMCGDQIIKNLLDKNDNKVFYITKDDDGDIEYKGYMFSKIFIDNIQS